MSGVASVSVDPDYMGVVKTDGTLWVWGLNSSGFPNWTASEEDLLRPAQLMENVAEVDCSSHMAVVKTDHILWLWGNNVCGQIGNGAWEATVSAPVQVMKDVAQVAVGNGHTIALKTDGSVWGWGVNDMGQAGGDAHHAQDSSGREIRSTPKQIVQQADAIVAGANDSFALDWDGFLWAWGSNSWGQLGKAEIKDGRIIPIFRYATSGWSRCPSAAHPV